MKQDTKQELKQLLKKLTDINAISGYEKRIRPAIENELKSHVDSMETDNMGNLIAKKGKGSPTYMICAHMDEIGFIVKHIDNDGYIRFIPIGGFWDAMLLDQNVVVETKENKFRGAIHSRDPWLMDDDERKKKIKWQDLFIDIGASSRQEVEKLGIKISNMITFDSNFRELAGDNVTGSSFDDRAGCAVLIQIMKNLKRFKGTVYAVFTAQEEVGLKGAKTSAFKINPDYSIALDVTTAHSLYAKEWEVTTKLGKGPCIEYLQFKGAGMIADPKLNKWIITVADENKIPLQLDAANAGQPGRTDASEIQLVREGIPSISIGIPTKYIHSNNEVCNLDDLDNTAKLIVKAVEKGKD